MQHSDFNLYDAFRIFDQLGRGSISLPELYNGMANHLSIVPSQYEIDLFFQRYDKGRDGKLSFAEFSEAFAPLDMQMCNVLNSRVSNFRSSSFPVNTPERVFVPLTLMEFKELIRTHFRVENMAEDLRQRLDNNPLFSLVNAFEVCDINQNGEVTQHELK